MADLNNKIEDGNNINWKSFKNLKEYYTDHTAFDHYDLNNFYTFYKDLYSKKCQRSNHEQVNYNPHYNPQDPPTEDDLEIINKPFDEAELDVTIRKLKNNKSISNDLVSNEMLKHSNSQLKMLLLKLFNDCLLFGVYPWNMSMTTPLHKKGDREDPDNYRAITL